MKLCLVEWVDSSTEYGWHQAGCFDDSVPICQSVGFLLKETDITIVLAHSRSNSGRYADTITIPKCSIKRTRNLVIKK